LDAIGASDNVVGELNEGSRAAQIAVRHYVPTIQQLSRAANWGFARKEGRLNMLQDATGQTTGVGTGTPAMGNWRYEYAVPIDYLRARWVTYTLKEYWLYPQGATPGNSYTLPSNPMMSNFGYDQSHNRQQQRWARFLVTQDAVPTQVGAPTAWGQAPDLDNVVGKGPGQQTVLLTNLCNASLVYTAFVQYPDEWDVLFQQAVVAVLASHMALAVLADKKFALQMRAQQIAVAKQAIEQARIADGNEGNFSSDIRVDWLDARKSYAWRAGWGTGNDWGDGGGWGGGWDAMAMADGTSF
jgi:hypothetical protein